MKKILLILFYIPLIGYAQSNDCNNFAEFGDIKICLPEIPNMTECYSDPLISLYADLLKGSDDEKILGIYLYNDVYESRYVNYENGMGDSFIKIYSTNTLEGIKTDEEVLDYLSQYIKEAFEDFDKSELKSKINNRFDEINVPLSLEKPILLEEYKLSTKIRSYVVLLKYKTEEGNLIQIATMNSMLIKDRIIFSAYYDEFKGFSQIDDIKAKSDYFSLKLLVENL